MNKVESLVRSLLPYPIKKLHHITRGIFLSNKKVNRDIKNLHIDQALLNNCLFCENRITMLDFLPKKSIVAELGTETGFFAKQIIERTSPLELHLCDVNFTNFDNNNIIYEQSVKKHEKNTLEFLDTFPEEFFDWIYIDASHAYKDVVNDIEAAKNKVKKGGLLIFNDFAHINPSLARFGVMRAVSEFIKNERWNVKYFALHPLALYDIAIEKPS